MSSRDVVHPSFIEALSRIKDASGSLGTFLLMLAVYGFTRTQALLPNHEPSAAGNPDSRMTWFRAREVDVLLRGGWRTRCRVGDLGALQSIFLDRDYESPKIKLWETRYILDVGAHVGTFTLWACQRSPGARIVAVEPNPEAFRYLKENIRRNDLDGRVTAVNAAIGGSSGHGRVVNRSSPLGVTVERVASSQSSDVEIWSLEELLGRASFPVCDLLKIDCEGAEYEAFLTCPADVLSRIRAIMCEYHPVVPYRISDLVTHLQGAGFNVMVDSTPVGMLWATRL